MPVKYHCPRCGKRYVEWGAEKMGFRCPDCEEEELVRIGSPEDRSSKKTSLKRSPQRQEASSAGVDEDEALVPDVDSLEEEDVGEEEEPVTVSSDHEEESYGRRSKEDLLLDNSDDSDGVSIEMSQGLPFGEVSPGLGEDSLGGEDDVSADWKD